MKAKTLNATATTRHADMTARALISTLKMNISAIKAITTPNWFKRATNADLSA